MTKFKYKFSTKIYVFIAIGFVLSAICLVLNVIRLINVIMAGSIQPYTVISISLAVLMSVAFAVIISGLLKDSSYNFEQKFLVVKFGIIKSNIDYKKIKQLVWFKENNKLTLFYLDETFSTVVIEDGEYDLFAETLLEKNSNIRYLVKLEGTN